MPLRSLNRFLLCALRASCHWVTERTAAGHQVFIFHDIRNPCEEMKA
ncbi:MAG: hypothetical protein ABW068_12935 [Candidatus Thiodiazotropha sp.]